MALIGALLALWLVAASYAVWRGVRKQQDARQAEARLAKVTALLQSAPAIPVLVRPDGRIEANDRLASWLGAKAPPAYVSELCALDGVLVPAHAQALSLEIAACQRGGRSIALPVSPRDSQRSLFVHGQAAAPDVAPVGSVVLWFFDATESQSEISTLRSQIIDYRTTVEALSGVIEAAPMPIWHRGPDLDLTFVNGSYVAAVDMGTARDVVRGAVELVEPAEGVTPRAAAAAASTSGAPVSRLVPATVDGERRMMRVVDVPLGEAGVAGYAIDVQELNEARDAYRDLVKANRDMLDRLSGGVAQFGADYRLQFFNQPFVSLFGLSSENVHEGIEFDRLLGDMRLRERIPEHRDFQAWREERRGWFQSPDAHEENWHLPDGLHLRVFAQPLPDGGLLLIFEDRTEQLQLSSARDTLLRVRAATFDNLFEAVAVFAADGRLHLWNSRFREIWSVEEAVLADHPRIDDLMARVGKALVRPEEATVVRQLIRAATVERRQRSGRVSFADGRFFEFAAIPLPDGNALFLMLDTTDSRRIEKALLERNEALEEADRVKTAFVSNMSYELRTPLTSIAGFAEMMQAGYAGTLSPQARDYIGAIMESTGRLSVLIDNVLDLTQGVVGRLPISRDPVDIAVTIGDVTGAATASAAERGIELVTSVADTAGTVSGDADRIKQMLDNILAHGFRHLQANGRMLIHADGTDKAARIIVSDNGPGLTDELVSRLFQPFAQAAGDLVGDPVDLGMPIARQIVEAHGGTIDLVTKAGEGTMITIELPR